MSKALRIIFMGTPDFAATALAALLNDGANIVAAYSQPPRPKGRGQQVQKSPVHLLAEKHGIPVFTPKNFKDAAAVEEFKALKADVAVVAAYGLILPKVILDAPTHGCINIHASLLPRWRGAAPIQRAIWDGDRQTGVTIMQMNEGLDTGPMIMREEVAITGETTAQNLHDELAALGGRMIVKTLDILQDKKILYHTPQSDEGATYASMLKKEDGKIDFTLEASAIDRQIRALTPWPGTYCLVDGKRLKITAATIADDTADAAPGMVLDKDGHVSCGDGSILKLEAVQPENKKPMDFAAAFNGGYIKVGDVLS
jgi:methionyl-tRNA formyltransferase